MRLPSSPGVVRAAAAAAMLWATPSSAQGVTQVYRVGEQPSSLTAGVPVLAYARPHLLPSHPAWQDPCAEARLRGLQDARHEHNSWNWLWGGAAAGFLTGPIGLVGITVVAASSDAQPLLVPEGLDPVCYRGGWERHARGRNTVAAAVGGVTGMVAGVAILTAAFAR